jgi:restriction endonuclease-like protein
VACASSKHAGVESWAEEVRRQRALERAGWHFWRCFAASFTRRREAVLADLTAALAARGIQPASWSGAQPLVLVEPRRVRMGAAAPQPLTVTVSA